MILPEDLEQFLKADGFWLKYHSHNFSMASFAFNETIRNKNINHWNQHKKIELLFPSMLNK